MNGPISPKACEGPLGAELPAYLSNGLVGLRVSEVPLHSGMAMLAGFCGEHPVRKIEAAAAAPYPLFGDIKLNGVHLSSATRQVDELRQSYDFSNGELTSSLRFTVGEAIVDVTVLTFCSRPDPAVVCQEISLEFISGGEVELSAGIDGQGVEGRARAELRDLPEETASDLDGALHWEAAGGLSTCGVAYSTNLEGVEAEAERPPLSGGRLITRYRFVAGAGLSCRLRQIAALTPSIDHARPDQQSVRQLCLAAHSGYEALRLANRQEWERIWKSRIRLIGADAHWQAMADAAFFYLMSSVHSASPASTSIFGLATWRDYHHYYGHVMWDVETFCLPVIALVQPNAARSMLDYRWRTLVTAEANARLHGRVGAQFPWESGPSTGQEAAPLPGKASWYEDHVSVDVAIAFLTYCRLTGDERYARERAWPVVSAVADWITERVVATDRGFEIVKSMGIAEREDPVDNPAYTNMAAKLVLAGAQAMAIYLGLPGSERWAEVAEQLVLPLEGGALVSHDGYQRGEEKGATPDPLMAFFPLAYPLAENMQKATLGLYLAQAQDYIGSPMLSALYGVWALHLGDRELAGRLLEDGYGRFAQGRFDQILEYRRDRFPEQTPAGPFFANMGGFLMSLMFGFPRIEPTDGACDTWLRQNAMLPAGWDAIEIDRVWLGGKPHRLRAVHGSPVTLTPI